MNGRPHIQTGVLQGVDGKGKFMSLWLSHSGVHWGTRASGRNETSRNTTTGIQQPSPNEIIMTTSISLHSRCCNSNSRQEHDNDKEVDITTQTQAMRDMV
jgi:hypothetical protein